MCISRERTFKEEGEMWKDFPVEKLGMFEERSRKSQFEEM